MAVHHGSLLQSQQGWPFHVYHLLCIYHFLHIFIRDRLTQPAPVQQESFVVWNLQNLNDSMNTFGPLHINCFDHIR